MQILTFHQALEDAERYSKRHLFLGNGFSIACRPGIFAYGRLYEQADFSKLSSTARLGFEALRTQDFERVIKALQDAATVLTAYNGAPAIVDSVLSDADGLRELLVQTIAASHPAWPGEVTDSEYSACRKFLGNFSSVYTLNYDLLLHWAKMHVPEGERPDCDDGFRSLEDDPDASYVVWDPSHSRSQTLWFLHGALHLFDSPVEIQKYTWANTGVRLIDQIRGALSQNCFPIFVSEGTSAEKYERIRHNDYLAKAYRSFQSIGGALFIFGHSLAENDEHYLKCVRGGKLDHVYVGLYGDPESDSNKFIRRRAVDFSVSRKRKVQRKVSFYDAASAKVWGR